jgi:hypothetical protein
LAIFERCYRSTDDCASLVQTHYPCFVILVRYSDRRASSTFPLHSRLPSFELAIQYVAALFLFSSPSFPCMWTRWAKKVYPSWIPSPLAEIDTLVVTSLRRR